MLELIEFVRKLLSSNKDAGSKNNYASDLIMKLGFAPILLSLLDYNSSQVRIEAAWAITNIAANKSEHCTVLREIGVPSKLISILSDPNILLELKEQVI